MHYDMTNMSTDYVALLKALLVYGQPVTVRDQLTYELTDVTLTFNIPSYSMLPNGIGRRVNHKLAALEALHLIGTQCLPELFTRTTPKFADVLVDADADAIHYAAYGPRITRQLPQVVRLLHDDPTTRQAVLQIWSSEDLTHTGDLPCTLSLQFLIRRDKLELHVNMRSNDVWLGTAYDLFVFTQLQWSVLHWLNALMTIRHQLSATKSNDLYPPPPQLYGIGKYVHHATSFHLYDRDVRRAYDIVEATPNTFTNDINQSTINMPFGIKLIPALVDRITTHDLTQQAISEILASTKFMISQFISPSDIATELLLGIGSSEGVISNPWYVKQLHRMNIIQPTPVNTLRSL